MTSRVRSSLAVVLVIGTVAAPQAAQAAFPGENGKIAWSRGPSYDLWAMDQDGSNPVRVYGNPGDERQVAFSPDGEKIAYSRPLAGGGFEVFVANADGTGGEIRVTNAAANDMHPSFSPSGDAIAYVHDNGASGSWDIYAVASNGFGVPTRLTSSEHDDLDPSWSPDGTKIAFRSSRSGTCAGDIFTMNPDGSEQLQLTGPHDPICTTDWLPDWTPDGAKIAWSRAVSGTYDIFMMDRDGSGKTNVTRGAFPLGGALDPAVSPDGAKIAVRAPVGSAAAPTEIFTFPISGGTPTRLTNDSAPDIEPAWQPRVPDADDDAIPDSGDNCPSDPNPDQADNDGDGIGDVCDPDDDNDGVADEQDAFPTDPTESVDTDGDGVGDNADNCPGGANPDQADADLDGLGDSCDPRDDRDSDEDGVANADDNCPGSVNPGQVDADADGLGDACDPDDDNDGVEDDHDAFPTDPTESVDTDGDGVGDNTDNCPGAVNADQTDRDGDGLGDACDARDDGDDDGDAVANADDNCPGSVNPGQEDADADGLGDACDPDDDNDGVGDEQDEFPTDPTESADTDSDGVGDNADNCPGTPNAGQQDSDADGLGDACDRAESTPGCTRGIGQLRTNPRAAFAFRASYSEGAGEPRGVIAFGDMASGRFLTSTRLTSLVIAGDVARVRGVGSTNAGRSVEFELEATDYSRTGRLDTFAIRWEGYVATDTLKLGNIEVPCDI